MYDLSLLIRKNLKDYHQIQSAFLLRVEQVFEIPLNSNRFVKYFYESFHSLWIYVNQHLMVPISDIVSIEYMQRKSYVYFLDHFIEFNCSLNENCKWKNVCVEQTLSRIVKTIKTYDLLS